MSRGGRKKRTGVRHFSSNLSVSLGVRVRKRKADCCEEGVRGPLVFLLLYFWFGHKRGGLVSLTPGASA